MRCWIAPHARCGRTSIESEMALTEFALIERYFGHCGAERRDVELGVGDDGALLRSPAGEDLVAAIDTLVEGVHFLPQAEPASIGHRALAVNLSDLAAMGGTPAWALLALTLPQSDEIWLEEFARGLGALACAHNVALVGGNTTHGPLTVTVQVLGHVPRGCALRRSGGGRGTPPRAGPARARGCGRRARAARAFRLPDAARRARRAVARACKCLHRYLGRSFGRCRKACGGERLRD